MNVLMNIRMVTLSWTMVVFVGAFAHAQDTRRVPDINRDVSAVDNSARRDINERRPQPSQAPRNSTSYSRWSLQRTTEVPSSQFGVPVKPGDRSTAANSSSQTLMQPSASTAWSHRTAYSGTALPSDPSLKGDQQQAPPRGLVRGRQRNGLKGSKPVNAYAPPPLPNSPTDQLSPLSREKPFGLNGTSLFPGFSPMGHPLQSKTDKSRTQSTARRRSTESSLLSSATK